MHHNSRLRHTWNQITVSETPIFQTCCILQRCKRIQWWRAESRAATFHSLHDLGRAPAFRVLASLPLQHARLLETRGPGYPSACGRNQKRSWKVKMSQFPYEIDPPIKQRSRSKRSHDAASYITTRLSRASGCIPPESVQKRSVIYVASPTAGTTSVLVPRLRVFFPPSF